MRTKSSAQKCASTNLINSSEIFLNSGLILLIQVLAKENKTATRCQPVWVHRYSPVAQLVERAAVNRFVASSSLARGANFQNLTPRRVASKSDIKEPDIGRHRAKNADQMHTIQFVSFNLN